MDSNLINLRRDFHKYPETGWLEMRTASLIARDLADLGYEPVMGKAICSSQERMGVPDETALEEHYKWALANGGDPEFLPETKNGYTAVEAEIGQDSTPLTILRFDIDALGVQESCEKNHKPANEAFASVSPGVMHSCAHDGHITIGLGVAEELMKMKDQIKGKVRLVFQPAEEGVRGARSVVSSGIADGADYVLAAHIVPDGGTGAEVAFIEGGGPVGLATSKLDIIFHGKASHAGANPELGNNAMLAAATATIDLHAIPRYAKVPTQINVGTLHAGTGRNVVCDRAKLEIETRGATSEANQYMEDYARRICQGAAAMHGCSVEIIRAGGTPALVTTKEITDKVMNLMKEKGYKVFSGKDLGRGSEDFAYFSERVTKNGGQALFFALPCKCISSNHSQDFDFDEEVLERGVRIFMDIIYELNGNIG